MILRKRKGIALITVVLIAALFLISIIGISAKVISEKKVSNARASSERALVTAETGFSQTLFDFRNVNFDSGTIEPSDVTHYLTLPKIIEIANNPVDHITDCTEQAYSGSTNVPYVTYHIKIKRLSGGYEGIWNPSTTTEDYDARNIPVQVYSLGTVYSDSTKAGILARRVITTECNIAFYKESETTYESSSEVFEYGLFSGGDIIFGGGAQEANGDIYAGGYIDLGPSPSKVRVNGGEARAHGEIKGRGQATDGISPEYPEIPFPELNVDYYKDLAHKFKTGAAPYDGVPVYDDNTPPNVIPYANLSDPLVLAVVQSYLDSDDTGNTVDEIQAFYADLKNYSGSILTLNVAQRDALWAHANSIVYFINPTPGDGTGTAIINAHFECQGTIVINGDLRINANAEIANDGGLAILVNGDIIRANGTASLSGLFYATGSMSGNGTFDCNGSIVTRGPIDLGGDFTVNYVPITNMPNLDIEGDTTIVTNGINAAEQSPSSWEEISYEEFQSP